MESQSDRTSSACQAEFDVCLAALQTGVALEDCLQLYPKYEAELRPMLKAVMAARILANPDVPVTAAKRSRAQLLAQAAQYRRKTSPTPKFRIPRLALATLSLLLVIIFSLNGLVSASAQTLPGDSLYSVKIAAEQVHMHLVTNGESQYELEEAYLQRRAEEVNELLMKQRQEQVSLEGKVLSITPDRWVVEGVPVVLTESTKVIGNIHPGQLIEVEGSTQPSGWVEADELHLRYYKTTGVVKEIARDRWQIDDIEYWLLSSTQIDPGLEIGDAVLVLVDARDNGMLYAQAVLNNPGLWVQFEPFKIEFSGLLEAVQGELFTIAGKAVYTSKDTLLNGDLTPGQEVRVEAILNADGSLTGLEISVQAPVSDNSAGTRTTPQVPDTDTEDDSLDLQTIYSDDSLGDLETGEEVEGEQSSDDLAIDSDSEEVNIQDGESETSTDAEQLPGLDDEFSSGEKVAEEDAALEENTAD